MQLFAQTSILFLWAPTPLVLSLSRLQDDSGFESKSHPNINPSTGPRSNVPTVAKAIGGVAGGVAGTAAIYKMTRPGPSSDGSIPPSQFNPEAGSLQIPQGMAVKEKIDFLRQHPMTDLKALYEGTSKKDSAQFFSRPPVLEDLQEFPENPKRSRYQMGPTERDKYDRCISDKWYEVGTMSRSTGDLLSTLMDNQATDGAKSIPANLEELAKPWPHNCDETDTRQEWVQHEKGGWVPKDYVDSGQAAKDDEETA